MGAAQRLSRTIRGSASSGESRNGKPQLPKGYGAMKDRIQFRTDIDLTKPITEQIFKTSRAGGRRSPRIAPAA